MTKFLYHPVRFLSFSVLPQSHFVIWIASIEFQKYWRCMLEGGRKKLILLIFSSRDDIETCWYVKVLYGSHMPELKRPEIHKISSGSNLKGQNTL